MQLSKTLYMSHILRKHDFSLCENKGSDQLRINCEADQRLCFLYMDSTISLLKSEIFKASILLHTRETVNLYTAGAPWKEKLTVSGVGVVGSN